MIVWGVKEQNSPNLKGYGECLWNKNLELFLIPEVAIDQWKKQEKKKKNSIQALLIRNSAKRSDLELKSFKNQALEGKIIFYSS